MGDRGNIVVQVKREAEEPTRIYFYTHWHGTELPQILQAALRRKERWDDEAYLARIIFCEMIQGDIKGATGFGISTGMPDNEHPILVVDTDNQRVLVDGDNQSWSFAAFCEIDNISWKALGV